MKNILIIAALLAFVVGAQAQYPSGKLFNLEVINELVSAYTEATVLVVDTLTVPENAVINIGDGGEISSRFFGNMIFRTTTATPNFSLLCEWNFMQVVLGRIPADSITANSNITRWWTMQCKDTYFRLYAKDTDGALAVQADSSGTVDFPVGLTAGTIEADNGWTGTWVNAESDTVHVVGGIITDVVSP